jgi:hypothetical protein
MQIQWERPIVINRTDGTSVIGSAEEAIVFLDEQWPEQRGYLYNLARRRCVANLEDSSLSRSARLAFHAAIAEIGMFPKEK